MRTCPNCHASLSFRFVESRPRESYDYCAYCGWDARHPSAALPSIAAHNVAASLRAAPILEAIGPSALPSSGAPAPAGATATCVCADPHVVIAGENCRHCRLPIPDETWAERNARLASGAGDAPTPEPTELQNRVAELEETWTALLREIGKLATATGDPDEWHEADDRTLNAEFDPWDVLRTAITTLTAARTAEDDQPSAPSAPEPPRCSAVREALNNYDEAAHCCLSAGHAGAHEQFLPWYERWLASAAVPPIPVEGGATTIAVSEQEQGHQEKTAKALPAVASQLESRASRDAPVPHDHCSRCQKDIGVYDPAERFTSGYYVVTEGYWSRFANPGEVFLCDACMWSDPIYRAERGAP